MGQEIRALRLMLKDLLEKHRTIKNILIEIKEFFMTPIKLLKKKIIEAEKKIILKEQKL